MQRRPTLSLVDGEPYALLHEDDAALMEGLLRQRPTWAGDAHTFDLFRDTQQVDDAAKIRAFAATYPSIPPCRSRWSGLILVRMATSGANEVVRSSW